MAGRDLLDKDWVDLNIVYLKNRLGSFPLFEASETFYSKLGEASCAVDHPDRMVQALNALFLHTGLPSVPVTFAPGLSHAGQFTFSRELRPDGTYLPGSITIADKYRNEGDARLRALSIGAIIAHEVAHYALIRKGILRQETDNERLCDLAVIVLGLGPLYLNGKNLIIAQRQEQLGYLSMPDMVYACMTLQDMDGTPPEQRLAFLTTEARFWVTETQKQVDASRKEYARREQMDEFDEQQEALASRLFCSESRLIQVKRDLNAIAKGIGPLERDQDRLNRTRGFWDNQEKYDPLMAEFTIASQLGSHSLTISRIATSVDSLTSRWAALAYELGAMKKERNFLDHLTRETAGLEEMISRCEQKCAGLSAHLTEVDAAHASCYSQIDPVRTECRAILEQVEGCRTITRDILAAHEYFKGNPITWEDYLLDEEIRLKVHGVIGTEGYAADLTGIARRVRDTDRLLAGVRSADPGGFPEQTSLSGIRSRLQADAEGVTRMAGFLSSLRDQQQAPACRYIAHAELLRERLVQECEGLSEMEKNMDLVTRRQKWIFDHHSWLAIDPDDEKGLLAITEAICTCSPDAEISRLLRIIGDLDGGVKADIQRVRGWRESIRVIPIQAYWNEYQQVFEPIQKERDRIAGWRTLQEKYILKWKRAHERSLMRKLREGFGKMTGRDTYNSKKGKDADPGSDFPDGKE